GAAGERIQGEDGWGLEDRCNQEDLVAAGFAERREPKLGWAVDVELDRVDAVRMLHQVDAAAREHLEEERAICALDHPGEGHRSPLPSPGSHAASGLEPCGKDPWAGGEQERERPGGRAKLTAPRRDHEAAAQTNRREDAPRCQVSRCNLM